MGDIFLAHLWPLNINKVLLKHHSMDQKECIQLLVKSVLGRIKAVLKDKGSPIQY